MTGSVIREGRVEAHADEILSRTYGARYLAQSHLGFPAPTTAIMDGVPPKSGIDRPSARDPASALQAHFACKARVADRCPGFKGRYSTRRNPGITVNRSFSVATVPIFASAARCARGAPAPLCRFVGIGWLAWWVVRAAGWPHGCPWSVCDRWWKEWPLAAISACTRRETRAATKAADTSCCNAIAWPLRGAVNGR